MRISRGSDANSQSESRSATFTGVVWGDPVFPTLDGLTVNTVFFTPRARTYWHSHENGQLLIVSHGKGYVANREGEISSLSAGDLVHTPGGEEHWHGAAPGSFMVHTSVSLGKADWLEEVTEEQYDEVCRA